MADYEELLEQSFADETALLAGIDPWKTMDRLADLSTRMALFRRAAGYRWLARHQRFPKRTVRLAAAGTGRFFWKFTFSTALPAAEQDSDVLPVEIGLFDDLATLLLVAAEEIGRYLERRIECSECGGRGRDLQLPVGRCPVCNGSGHVESSDPYLEPYE